MVPNGMWKSPILNPWFNRMFFGEVVENSGGIIDPHHHPTIVTDITGVPRYNLLVRSIELQWATAIALVPENAALGFTLTWGDDGIG